MFFKSAYSTSTATKQLKDLLGARYFDGPKPVPFLLDLIQIGSGPEDIVLDFFAGSGTTGHAVMELNAQDGGSRRFILVQLPEPTPDGSEARAAGLGTIPAITRRRLDLAATRVGETHSILLSARDEPIDLGFRSWRLAESNFSKWRVSSDVEPNALEQHLLDLRESSSDDTATPDDLLTEILLKQGYSLTEKIAPVLIQGLDLRAVYDRDGDFGVLAYLNEHVKPTLEQVRAVVESAPAKLIMLEDAFQGDDELKTNLVQLAKSKNVELWTA